jgi:hypothetical protein
MFFAVIPIMGNVIIWIETGVSMTKLAYLVKYKLHFFAF